MKEERNNQNRTKKYMAKKSIRKIRTMYSQLKCESVKK
jgi:hypothetical protein